MSESVIVVGTGGREEMIKQSMEPSPEVSRARTVDIDELSNALSEFHGNPTKPFIVIGPEQPAVDGLTDELRRDGYTVLGATKDMAQYEASKSYAIQAMRAGKVPHPPTFISMSTLADQEFMNSANSAKEYVIKADGLAGGKGAFLPDTAKEAGQIVANLRAGAFNGSGKDIINFAKRRNGPEVSAMILAGDQIDDFTILPLAQDHKRLLDGDKGPNTGGMGAYAPLPESIVSPVIYEEIAEVGRMSLEAMSEFGVPYRRAVLYMGLMLSEENGGKPEVIEYNIRLGDPETQPQFAMLMAAGIDTYRLLRSTAEGSPEQPTGVDFRNLGHHALTVCLASAGYPESPEKDRLVKGYMDGRGQLIEYEGVSVQLAGVNQANPYDVYTNGGRVLYVTATGETLDEASTRAYRAIGEKGIYFDGMHYRSDIGHQARSTTA